MINKKIIGLMLTIFILVAGCTTSNRPVNEEQNDIINRIYKSDPQRELIGQKIEDFHFIDLVTNKQVHFDEISKDKVVIIQSFSNGCPACVRGIEEYNQLYDKYDIEILYLDISDFDKPEDILAVKEEYDGKDWIWADYQGSLIPFYEKYNFRTNDMTIIVNKQGEIIYADSFAVPRERIESELSKIA